MAGSEVLDVVLVTSFGDPGGGSELVLASYLGHLRHAIRVRAIMLQHGPFEGVLSDLGAHISVYPTGASPGAILGAGRPILRELRRYRPAVVIANGVKAMTAVAVPARSLRLPTVWLKMDHSFDRPLARPLGRLSTSVIATAEEVGIPTGRDDVIAIEPARPDEPLPKSEALAELAALGWRPGPERRLVMIGRLVPYKGVDVAIKSLVYRESAGWRLAVIGPVDAATPGEGERLQELAHSLGVADRVDFLGSIPHAGRLVRAFTALAVLTRPGQSRAPTREGFGITATEAMLGSIPVIMAGEGPISRRIRTPDGPAGVVIRQSDPGKLAQALRRLGDPEVRNEMGRAGRAAALTQPDDAQAAARFLAVVKAAADGAKMRA
ncbi:MAG: hypothetical protein QG597_3687 [Actinomycetota bacterium]|nr:hypothetical protein [Actinomycetota bacterium]